MEKGQGTGGQGAVAAAARVAAERRRVPRGQPLRPEGDADLPQGDELSSTCRRGARGRRPWATSRSPASTEGRSKCSSRPRPTCRPARPGRIRLIVIAKVAAPRSSSSAIRPQPSNVRLAKYTRSASAGAAWPASAPRARRPSRARFMVLILVAAAPTSAWRAAPSTPPLYAPSASARTARHVWETTATPAAASSRGARTRLRAVQLGRGLLLLVETDGAAAHGQPRRRRDQHAAAAQRRRRRRRHAGADAVRRRAATRRRRPLRRSRPSPRRSRPAPLGRPSSSGGSARRWAARSSSTCLLALQRCARRCRPSRTRCGGRRAATTRSATRWRWAKYKILVL